MSLVELPPELDKIVSEIARRTGKTKQQVIIDILTGKDEVDVDKIRSLAESLASMPTPSTPLGGLNLASTLKEMALTMLYVKMMEGLTGSRSNVDLEKIIALKMATQPDITQLILPLLLGKREDNSSQQMMIEFLRSMQEQNQKFNEMLMQILLQNRASKIEELEKKVDKELPEYINQLLDKTISEMMEQTKMMIQQHMEEIRRSISAVPPEQRESEIDRMAKEIAETIVRESVERVKKDIERRFKAEDTPEALKNLNYDKLFEKTFDLAKDVLKSILSRPPPKKEVVPVPVQPQAQPAQPQQQPPPPPEQPQPEPEVEYQGTEDTQSLWEEVREK